jgi:ornithine carbamoyltransferase
MELTKEHFDQEISKLATKEQIEDLARMTSRGFDDVLERLDVRERMQAVENNLQLIAETLHITLQK